MPLQLLSVGFIGEAASGQTDFTNCSRGLVVKSLSQMESSEGTSLRPPGAAGSQEAVWW